LRARIADWRRAGLTVGLVPTMGALHEGHLSLVREALRLADRAVVSLFVNPKQFAPTEDLDRYPRRESEDARLLAAEGCDLLWAPTPDAVYPEGFATAISVGGPAEGLETEFRPHFFGGVATVVTKLFTQVLPDVAVFGEKDYQQLQVVKRLARDLDLPVEVVGRPTIRDEHGLALSSRNAYLDERSLRVARRLNVIMAQAAGRAAAGEPVRAVEADASEALLQGGFDKVDYVAIRGAEDLKPFANVVNAPARVLVAAWLGSTRLIDNMAVG
jgi:pantoate--beta-alanine ligase